MTSVTIDTRGMEARLARLKQTEIPGAMRHALNDLAFDCRNRVITEIQRVFDRPTPIVQKLPQVKKQKTNADKPPELWLTDFFDTSSYRRRGPSYAIEPHIPGRVLTRGRKGLEIRLERMGLITAGEWMMPGKAVKLDAYGNVPGAEVSKMIADIGAYNQYAGDANNTGSGKRAAKRKYIWVKTGKTRGIFTRQGSQLTPQMIAVRKTPRFAPRFKFDGVVKLYSARRIAYHARRAVEQQIARKNRA